MSLKFLSCCWLRFEYFWLAFAFQQTSCDRENLQLALFNLFIVICFTWPRKLSFRLFLSGESISEPAPRGLLAAPVSQRSKVRILYKPESFQVFFSQLQKLF